ncbi:L [Taro vein chlorosis virus]|uniref:RNA-directed RNA polymerase L n=1 Tax=Taro vein chlorosis virus TaxID=2749935 RepID=L_TAVCV|nr:L [Taro vein chlorosis virus] [Taro vein chlorosis virus]Q5GA85.1 RecName: Full=RNA-directed RNA polymerase L; Short=Protein L; AltName: Full=Large structural protein; AltName: Full=Replicase; AltName: Full=Transcriptase; Includes: RecName: Full=RNA-directed RNA polymerase; Includes: RecName: Full=GTP phosphohydrolase; Includes: RecName: Full=GDP polyribonucleotidyltransferase; AltName: Full=PRNTase; Includes: RecName: Full=mRNA cap methyltransferase; AltName: Full=mRNA (guanine-N(7)-)-methyltr
MDSDYPDLDPEALTVLDSIREGIQDEEEEDNNDKILSGTGDYHLKSALRTLDDMTRHPIFNKEYQKAVRHFGISPTMMMTPTAVLKLTVSQTKINKAVGFLFGDILVRLDSLPWAVDCYDSIQAEIKTMHSHMMIFATPSWVEDVHNKVSSLVEYDHDATLIWATVITLKNYLPAWREKGASLLDWRSVQYDPESEYLVMKVDRDFIIYVGSDICVMEIGKQTLWAPVPYILNGADKVAERYNVKYYCALCDELDIPDRISLEKLNQIIEVGDDCLQALGNKGYDIIGSYEALLAGIIQARDNPQVIPDRELLQRTTLNDPGNTIGVTFLKRWDALMEDLNPEQIACAHGLYRIWGHPAVDILGGINKMREVASIVKLPSSKILTDIGRQFKEMFFTSYHSVHKHYPKHLIREYKSDSYIHECLKDNRTLNSKVLSYHFPDWDSVALEKNFEVPYSWNLVHNLKDKAISPSRSELYETLSTRNSIFGASNRRGILKSLTMETVQLRAFLQDVNDKGLPDNDKIIGVYPKERELKIKARLFSLMSFKLRLYFVSTEALLGDKILKYFPQITMSLDMLSMIKKMFRVSGQTTRGDDSVTVIFNLDFVKWNLQMRKIICSPVFTQLGALFGMPNLFDITHDLFRESVIYLCSGEGDLRGDPVFGVAPDGVWSWTGDESGKEGLRQKGWTILTVVTIMLIAKRHHVDVSLMGGGDNQVLGITIGGMVRDSVGELTQDSCKLAQCTIKRFTQDLITTFGDLGLPLKASETWVSDSLFMYNKHMFYKGMPLRSPLKAVSRIFPLANDSIMTLDNMINNISSGVKAACMKERHGIPLVFIKTMAYRRVAELSLIMHPLTVCFKKPELPDHGIVARSGKKLKIPVTSKNLRQYFSLCTLGSSTMGHPGTLHLPDIIMRGFPDPLTSHLSFISEMRRYIVDPGLASVVDKLSHLSTSPTTEYAKLVEDPTSINHDAPTHGLNEIRQMSRDFLMSTTLATNPHLKSLFSLLDRGTEKDFYDALCSAQELDVKVLHEIAGATLYGYTNGIASRIDQTGTVRALNENIDVLRRLALAETRYIGYLMARDTREHDLKPSSCSRITAQQYRDLSWRKPILGVTVPHPMEMCQIMSSTETIYHDAVVCWSDRVSGSEIYQSMGQGKIYQGSYTKERFKATDIAAAYGNEDILVKAVRLQKLINWRYDEGSNFAKIISLTLEAITDANTEGFHRSKEEIKGEFDHRRGVTGDISGGIPNFLVTPTSHFSSTTSSWVSHSRGGKNENIHFQSVLINLLYRAMVYRGSVPGLPEMIWYSKEKCSDCITEIKDPDPIKTTPSLHTLPSAKGNPFAYIESVNVKLDYHHQIEITKGMEEEYLINSLWDGQNVSGEEESGLLLYLMLIGSRQISESFILLMRERINAATALQYMLNRVILARKLGLDSQFPIRSTSCVNLLLGTDDNILSCRDRFNIELLSGSWESGVSCDMSVLYRDDLLTASELHVNVYLQNVPLQLALSRAASSTQLQSCLECQAIVLDRPSQRELMRYLHWCCPYHTANAPPRILRIHSEKLIKGIELRTDNPLLVPYVCNPVTLERVEKVPVMVDSWELPVHMHSTWDSILPQLYLTLKSLLSQVTISSLIVDDDITLINLAASVMLDLRRELPVYINVKGFSGTEINNKFDNLKLLPPNIRSSVSVYHENRSLIEASAAVWLPEPSSVESVGADWLVLWGDTWRMGAGVPGHVLVTESKLSTGMAWVLHRDPLASQSVLELCGAVQIWEKKALDWDMREGHCVPIQMNRTLACSRLGSRGVRWTMWSTAAGLDKVTRILRSKLLSLSGNPGSSYHWRKGCQKILKAYVLSLYAHCVDNMLEASGRLVGVSVHGSLSGIVPICDMHSSDRIQRAQYLFLKERCQGGPFILRNRLERRINLLSPVHDLLDGPSQS